MRGQKFRVVHLLQRFNAASLQEWSGTGAEGVGKGLLSYLAVKEQLAHVSNSIGSM